MDALLARADELARRWAIALIVSLPLERIGEIPLQSFAREAPVLCAQVVRALESDAELERIGAPLRTGADDQPAPARRLGELAAARDGPAAVEAVEALRGVLWEALLDELRWPSFEQSPARRVGELADRLAFVCSTALGSTLAASPSALRLTSPHADVHITATRVQPASAETPSPASRRRTPTVSDRLAGARGFNQARERHVHEQHVREQHVHEQHVREQHVHEQQAEQQARERDERLTPAEAAQPSPHAHLGAGRESGRADLGDGVVIIDEGAPPLAASAAQAPVATAARRGRALPWEIPLSRDAEEPA